MRAGGVHELEGAHRMTQRQFASEIDILRGRYSLFDQPDGLDHEGMEHPVDREAGDILDQHRCLADLLTELTHTSDDLRRGAKGRYHLDQLHPRDRGEVMRAEE